MVNSKSCSRFRMWPLMFAKVQLALLEKKKRDKNEFFHAQADLIDEEINSDSEIQSQTAPQGGKHMALASVNSEMDPKRAAAMLERRRVSASVHEIQDLYSALQELVPGGATSSLSQRVNSTDNKPTDVSSNPNSPNLRRKVLNNRPRDVARSPTSEDESTRVRRLLPVTPDSPSNPRKFNPKVIQALDVNANQSLVKGKRNPNMGRRGSSGEVLLSMQSAQSGKPSPNMGRRGSSGAVLLAVRANQHKAPKSPLALTRSASHHNIAGDYETDSASPVLPSPVKLDRLISPEVLARRGSEGVLLTPKMDKHHKKLSPLLMKRRGSSGDILTSESSKPTSVSLPRSAASSPRKTATLDSGIDSSPRRGSLINALTKFSHTFKKKTPPSSPERKEIASIKGDFHGENQTVVDGQVQNQMDMLLNSLNDLQGTSQETNHGNANESEILKKLDQRRGSLGTEMQELLGALQELSAMTTSSDSDSLGDNESQSRRGSELQDRVHVQRESLEQLEAYFTEKLRDATIASTSKTPSERSSESDAPLSDKEDGELSQPPSELSSKKSSLETAMVDEGIDVVDYPTEVLPTDVEVKRTQLKEDREEFANQVNKKLQDWLEKAMALSEREKNSATFDSDEAKYDYLDSDESDYNKEKEPKRMKRNLFSKLSLLRRGDRSRPKYKHRRTKSMHDVTFSLENELSFQDKEIQNPTTTNAQNEDKLRRPSVTRSRSMYNVTLPRSKNHSKRQVREAEDVPQASHTVQTQSAATLPDDKRIQASHVLTTSSKDYCHVTEKSSPTLLNPEMNTTPNRQTPGNKNVKRSAQKTRLCRLPTDLPFFYTPKADKSLPCTRVADQHCKQTKSQDRIKRFPKNSANCTGMEEIFYNEKASDNRKLRKACSNTLPHPRILVNDSTNYFFGATPNNNQSEGETLFYQGDSPKLTPLRRFASVDSFLDSKDCEEPRTNGSCCYGNELSVDDAARRKMCRGQSPCPSPPSNLWEMEFTI
ncbi:uncharacterized protein LOC110051262 isoform X3 [Orbicella faveolata]|uniref:uncharacterized protein LOC110051262 isoform X3 n=1 Tax=Orbicella faveolata TaxID=48498 RepID=UPI0009E1F649|nr:uncharacterized protein LOC110051262 isoform X3 [Orbicella faveolata]